MDYAINLLKEQKERLEWANYDFIKKTGNGQSKVYLENQEKVGELEISINILTNAKESRKRIQELEQWEKDTADMDLKRSISGRITGILDVISPEPVCSCNLSMCSICHEKRNLK